MLLSARWLSSALVQDWILLFLLPLEAGPCTFFFVVVAVEQHLCLILFYFSPFINK